LFSLPECSLFQPQEEHQHLRRTLHEFVLAELEPQALEHDRSEKWNQALFKKLGTLGLLGVTVPEIYGGSGMDAVAACIVHEELSWSDPACCLSYLAHSMLCANNIAVNGSETQKKSYLPKLCSGEWIGAMGMSEAGAGTDVLAMQTKAEKKGSDYVVNGRKMWITNGTLDEGSTPCDVLLLYAQSGKKDGKPMLSSFIIESLDKGFSVGQKIRDKSGMRASNTAELCFDQCKVPSERLVGAEGEAMLHMMRNLEIERLTLAAMAVGIARRCLEVMIAYAKERQAFGHKLHHFGQIQTHIAESFAEYQAAKIYVYQTAAELKLGQAGQRLNSDGVKLFATPVAKRIADRAIQVLGGYGYVGEYHVERLWRDSKLLEIGGGTLESHQKNIVRDLVRE
jgi:isovaleryl-CoA dehydrogenase